MGGRGVLPGDNYQLMDENRHAWMTSPEQIEVQEQCVLGIIPGSVKELPTGCLVSVLAIVFPVFCWVVYVHHTVNWPYGQKALRAKTLGHIVLRPVNRIQKIPK